MSIVSVRDNENNRWRRNGKTKAKNKNKNKRFCCTFKLGFLQLICKTSLIFKSNLQLALSMILKETELCESKHVAV